jgi:protein-S-isoprenylcysteine O-methyltransferase Ste14
MLRKISLFSVLIFLFAISSTFAQFTPDKDYAGPSIGLSFLGSTVQFGANYEHSMVVKDFGTIGIGGIFRYWSYSEDYIGGDWSYTNVLIGAQGNYHFKMSDNKFDPWAGLILAYDAGSVSWDGPYSTYASPSYGGLFLGLHGGMRYWFSPNLAGTARIGFGTLSYGALDIGVDFKF